MHEGNGTTKVPALSDIDGTRTAWPPLTKRWAGIFFFFSFYMLKFGQNVVKMRVTNPGQECYAVELGNGQLETPSVLSIPADLGGFPYCISDK
jgi:hypothetical protein